jgi:hypothetical protein
MMIAAWPGKRPLAAYSSIMDAVADNTQPGWLVVSLERSGAQHELEDRWEVFVQTARCKPMAPIRDDHPDPERRGKVFKFPEVIEEPDNKVFSAFEGIVQ